MAIAWHPQIYPLFQTGQYEAVATFYEQQIEAEPEILSHYWYLGLTYLLQGEETAAQTTWLLPLAQGVDTNELVNLLDQEAHQQKESNNFDTCWLIRRYIQEFQPDLLNNLLHLIEVEVHLQQFSPQHLKDWGIIELLREGSSDEINTNLLIQVLANVLEFPSFAAVDFAQACVAYFPDAETLITFLQPITQKIAYEQFQGAYAADLIKIALQLQPNNLELLNQLVWFNLIGERYDQALAASQQFYEQATTLDLKLFGNYHILSTLLHGGHWLEVDAIAQRHQDLLKTFIQSNPETIHPIVSSGLQSLTLPLFYLQDNPRENRYLQNQVSRLFQSQTVSEYISHPSPSGVSRPLNIGYIGHTFRRHSVGWLGRWIFHHHNRNDFNIFIYAVNQQDDDLTQQWFSHESDRFYRFQRNPQEVIQQIQADQIDILVDLDSITHNMTCQTLAQKPAPIQVTWLCFDASGLPAIDYFIADPYILPEDAQSYYSEKIWRLPHCYLAIDGSEVGVPTLRREDLKIPPDAITYLTVQTGLKRHPETIRLQLQILQGVPNSYLLIQGTSHEQKIQELFQTLAQEEGISVERLRFLPTYPTEVYRANLAIADVVLDTYPFNGGTTTLDILWMGIPVVTRVGQQWASRNSYTLMTNAGISEGISWTDDEYIQWGIKLGTNEQLRDEITWKLKKSRQTSPLWNAKQFTQDMEKAYQQMWLIYQNK